MMIQGRLSGSELDERTAKLEKSLDDLCHRAGEILTEKGDA